MVLVLATIGLRVAGYLGDRQERVVRDKGRMVSRDQFCQFKTADALCASAGSRKWRVFVRVYAVAAAAVMRIGDRRER